MENSFWKRKTAAGKGTQEDIVFNYNNINQIENCFTTATMRESTGEKDDKGNLIYEYMIFYQEKPVVGQPEIKKKETKLEM